MLGVRFFNVYFVIVSKSVLSFRQTRSKVSLKSTITFVIRLSALVDFASC